MYIKYDAADSDTIVFIFGIAVVISIMNSVFNLMSHMKSKTWFSINLIHFHFVVA